MQKMNVAIVEDDAAAVEKLRGCLAKYTEERGTEFNVTVFSDAVFFLFHSSIRASFFIFFYHILLSNRIYYTQIRS